MYKIYINETPVFLTHSDQILSEWKHDSKALIHKYLGKPKFLHSYIDLLEKPHKFSKVILFYPELGKMWHDFQSIFTPIEAAGGVVYNDKDQILVIYRRENWDLPKGKLDEGETAEKAAIREVQEETGLGQVSTEKHIVNTYHTYSEKGKRILKRTHWYKMKTVENKLTPQASEDIEKAEWVDMTEFLEAKPKTYGSILDVLEAAQAL